MYIRKATSARSLIFVPPGCPDIFPSKDKKPQKQLLETETYVYCTLSDGKKTIFTDHDGLQDYDSSAILAPDQVSFINLFINGMIQPPILYEVTKGMLRLKTTDIPREGVIIVLQFIRILWDPA